MRYESNGKEMAIGDRVSIDGTPGLVVCDFEAWQCLPGYESWLTKEKLADGSTFISGVMIETKAYGFIHYSKPDAEIAPAD